ncbi:hypothetical protein CLPU_2c02380 [Gottschalkia purinilytica]|uniref:Uncharacterized protein n=1 Tax=Gottschalkia purinilytica TaxID=1503 RepID=A0A0L0WEC2_GOTPU|nr:M60 family metallopeptidase [Gottschalkia purinilytica]KNF09786.1 hypothetical protein CLPU_2c02380 [Gottschalkia purinilytica]
MKLKRACAFVLSSGLILTPVSEYMAYASPVVVQNDNYTTSTKENITTITLEQNGNLDQDIATKRYQMGPSKYLSTGIYKKPNEPITIHLSSTDQIVYPRVVISDPVLKKYQDGNKSGIQLSLGKNEISVPEGGIVYLINESEKTNIPPTVTIEGGQKIPYFVLGKNTLSDWKNMLSTYGDVPVIELVSKHAIITAGIKQSRHVDNPEKLLQYFDEAIEHANKLTGLDKNDKDYRHKPTTYRYHFRETSEEGYWMYAWYNHTAYASAAVDKILNSYQFKHDGWGPWHELGHTYQQRAWMWGGTGEVTNNIYSLAIQKHFGNQTRLEEEKVYDKAFKYLQQPSRDFNSNDDLFLKLVMFWQLHLGFGDDFYPTIQRTYREMPQSKLPGTDAEKIQTFIVTASKTANYNLTPFFEKWGLYPTTETKGQIKNLPQLTKPIWQLTDSNVDEIMNGEDGEQDKDNQAPTAPTQIKSISETENSITLQWNLSTDNIGVKGYEIYRNDEKIGTTTSLTYTDTGLTPNISYIYTVKAFDEAGNYATSEPITVKTKEKVSNDLPQWDPNKVYLGGERVIYNGLEYEAKYWTQGNNPSESDVWKLLSDTVVEWSKNKPYNGGDKVTYNGHTYQAKYWTQGNTPGQSDVWVLIK